MKFFQIRPAIRITAVLALLGVCAFAFAADQAASDKVAVVNGVTISKGEFDRELDFFVRRAAPGGQQLPDFQMAKMKNEGPGQSH